MRGACFLPLALASATATAAPPDGDTAAAALANPGTTPRLVAPGVVDTGDDEAHATLSPDGRTLFFLKDTPSFDLWTIVYTERRGGAWTRPRTASFSGRWGDGDLTFTPDGRRAYFVSNRPVDGKPREDTEIWTVERDAGGRWGEPRHVAELSSPTDEWFPTLASDGSIYFGSGRPGGQGGSDIWRAPRAGDHFGPAENLGAEVNSKGEEIEAFIAPDQSFLVLAAARRPDTLGAYDLYVARRVDGKWQAPRHLAAPINSPGWEFGPRLSPDGKLFFFTSSRGFGSQPLERALSFDELEQRLHAPGNGLRDIYVVDAAVLRPE
jgi:Tol biopolymer transport system component